jgi:nitroimidazol reductase NimA-like FMN-containing flavoprotein (pyridoxamine 5'-phosphate oxidase superfamily)
MPSDSVTMAADERDQFLGPGGTGVLSYARGSQTPYAVPVSYGYDADTETFYFRLATGPESEKQDLPGRKVTFVTHRETDRWRSVVAAGKLERTTEENIALKTLEGLRRVHIPLVDIFGRPPSEVDFEFFRLVPDELDARVESPTSTER